MAVQHATVDTVDRDEMARFAALARDWWDPRGPMRPLHEMNPERLRYIRRWLCNHFDLSTSATRPLDGLRILDLGCGGGVVSEPLARLGADLVAVDAQPDTIEIARRHAREAGLEIDFRCTTAEALTEQGAEFDAIVSMEVLEHVADLQGFVQTCGQLLRPGGAIVLSTLNRTAKSFLFGIAVAEHLLRLLPVGTHEFEKFVRPAELIRHARNAGLDMRDFTGLGYAPLDRRWRLSRDLSVNYLAYGVKAAD